MVIPGSLSSCNLSYFKVIHSYSNLSSFEYGNLLSFEDFVGFRQQSVSF